MADVRAVVLAAGRGIRMGGGPPKTLLPVRANQPLLYYVLDGLKTGGIDDLLVVTGHRPGEVQEFVGSHWEGKVQFVFNARFASWGNFHSVRMALDQSPGFDTLVVNSDVVISPDVYSKLRAAPGDLALAVVRRDDLDDEDMRVRLSDDRVLAIGKDLKRVHGHGEFAGISLLRSDAAHAYLDVATDLEWLATTDLYYEDVYMRMLPRLDVRAVDVPRDGYAEVDRWSDMESAAKVIKEIGAWNEPPPPSETSGDANGQGGSVERAAAEAT